MLGQVAQDIHLRRMSTARLLEEHANYAGATAQLRYLSQQAESASKENPVTISADDFTGAVKGAGIRQKIEAELKRRGVTPPE